MRKLLAIAALIFYAAMALAAVAAAAYAIATRHRKDHHPWL